MRDYTCVIDDTGPRITVTNIYHGGRETEYYVTDGQERVALPDSHGIQLRAKAYWDGNTLVIEKRREGEDFGVSVYTMRYELSADGKILHVSEHFVKSPFFATPFDVFRTFEKQR